nr:hypothetical protein Iba_chr12bCG6160 [Ipomoea batatas]
MGQLLEESSGGELLSPSQPTPTDFRAVFYWICDPTCFSTWVKRIGSRRESDRSLWHTFKEYSIRTWLNSHSITTVYEQIAHHFQGIWIITTGEEKMSPSRSNLANSCITSSADCFAASL